MAINKAMVTGNLTREPEFRQTATGLGVLTFCVAVNDRRKNSQSGEWEDYPNYIDCSMLGARAEKLSTMLHKGMKVAVEGKLHYSSWERDGQKRSKLELNVEELDFMSQRQQQQPQYVEATYCDSDIPF